MTLRSSKISKHNHVLREQPQWRRRIGGRHRPCRGQHPPTDYTLVWNEAWLRENSHVLAVLTNADGEVLNCLDLPWTE